jgi:hypothetical protein
MLVRMSSGKRDFVTTLTIRLGKGNRMRFCLSYLQGQPFTALLQQLLNIEVNGFGNELDRALSQLGSKFGGQVS